MPKTWRHMKEAVENLDTRLQQIEEEFQVLKEAGPGGLSQQEMTELRQGLEELQAEVRQLREGVPDENRPEGEVSTGSADQLDLEDALQDEPEGSGSGKKGGGKRSKK